MSRNIEPDGDGKGIIGGRHGEAWAQVITDVLTVNGSDITSTEATKFNALGDADGAGTCAMGTNAQTLTSAKTDGDMFLIQGLGNFGDVSVMRVESKTGNPTDGTVLEVISHDANVDPLVVSTSAQAGALVVGQSGTVTVVGDLAVGGNVTADNINTFTTEVTVTAAQVKALRATPKPLVAAVAANIIEFVSAVLVLDYGSEVFTETADNLVIEYEDGRDITAAIETTGFIDQAVDQVAIIGAADVPTFTAAAAVNKSIQLKNTGDGEIGGNASNDSVLLVRVTYRLHPITL